MRVACLVLAIALTVAACADGDGGNSTVPAPPITALTTTTISGAATTSTAASPADAATRSTTAPTATTTSAAQTDGAAPFDTWIAILASLPTGEFDVETARSMAADINPAARVLLSDHYASLNPGFWVVYLGVHEFEWEAAEACPDAVPDCYTSYLAGISTEAAVGAATDTALAATDFGELVVLDTTTGETLRTLDRSIGDDGQFPGPLSLAGDGQSAYYSVGFEDFWFSCDASDGTLMHLPFEAGAAEQIGDGFSPDVSADGRYLLYLASSDCFPDPTEPQFVLAPIDIIVRRDLSTGAERRVFVPLAGDVADGYELWSAVWGPDGDVYVLDTLGGLWWFPSAGDGEPWLEAGTMVTELPTQHDLSLIGYDNAADLLLVNDRRWTDDQPTTTLVGIDVELGRITTTTDFAGAAEFALDGAGRRLLSATDGRIDAGDGPIPADVTIWQLAW